MTRPRAILTLLLCCLAACMPMGRARAAASPRPLPVRFYFVPGCPRCKQAKAAVADAEQRLGARISVRRFDLTRSDADFKAYVELLDRLGIRTTPNLLVVIGEHDHLEGKDKIIDLLLPTLRRRLAAVARTSPAPPPRTTGQKPRVRPAPHARIERTDLVMLSTAALVDGFNPCAFATVILFVSMLAAVGRGRREVLVVGASFMLAVFITYLAIGLTFFKAMAMVSHLRLLSRAISWVALGMVTLAGAFSLVDGLRALRRGGGEGMLLVLPDFLKHRIRGHLTRSAHARGLVLAAFLAGIAISFLESACTGQVYFPLILGLVQDGTQATRGLLLLLWYNVLFILPLVAVFALSLAGVSSETIAVCARRRVWLAKFALAAVFFAMAAWLAYG